jgi:Ran GTPase-activating protein (RanGAP) involved in mRNA processing and transport
MPQGARHLATMLMTNTTLQTLDLVNTGIADAGAVAIFRALKQNPALPLKHLYLGSNAEGPRTGQAAGDFLASGQSKLTSLILSCSRLGDEGVSYIAAGLRRDTKLERLALESARIGDVGAKALADALEDHPALIMLDLGYRKGTYELGERGNEITGEGAMYIGEKLIGKPGARKPNTLRSIDLSSNSISKEEQHQFFENFVVGNEKLLRVRLGQKGANSNPKLDLTCRKLVNEHHSKYFEAELTSEEENQERERVRDALEPQHIKEIYSIYRGNM